MNLEKILENKFVNLMFGKYKKAKYSKEIYSFLILVNIIYILGILNFKQDLVLLIAQYLFVNIFTRLLYKSFDFSLDNLIEIIYGKKGNGFLLENIYKFMIIFYPCFVIYSIFSSLFFSKTHISVMILFNILFLYCIKISYRNLCRW